MDNRIKNHIIEYATELSNSNNQLEKVEGHSVLLAIDNIKCGACLDTTLTWHKRYSKMAFIDMRGAYDYDNCVFCSNGKWNHCSTKNDKKKYETTIFHSENFDWLERYNELKQQALNNKYIQEFVLNKLNPKEKTTKELIAKSPRKKLVRRTSIDNTSQMRSSYEEKTDNGNIITKFIGKFIPSFNLLVHNTNNDYQKNSSTTNEIPTEDNINRVLNDIKVDPSIIDIDNIINNSAYTNNIVSNNSATSFLEPDIKDREDRIIIKKTPSQLSAGAISELEANDDYIDFEVMEKQDFSFNEKEMSLDVDLKTIISNVVKFIETAFGDGFQLFNMVKDLEVSISNTIRRGKKKKRILKHINNNYLFVKVTSFSIEKKTNGGFFRRVKYYRDYEISVFCLVPNNRRAIMKCKLLMSNKANKILGEFEEEDF